MFSFLSLGTTFNTFVVVLAGALTWMIPLLPFIESRKPGMFFLGGERRSAVLPLQPMIHPDCL